MPVAGHTRPGPLVDLLASRLLRHIAVVFRDTFVVGSAVSSRILSALAAKLEVTGKARYFKFAGRSISCIAHGSSRGSGGAGWAWAPWQAPG